MVKVDYSRSRDGSLGKRRKSSSLFITFGNGRAANVKRSEGRLGTGIDTNPKVSS